MARRKYTHHGARRKIKKIVTLSGTGAQTASISAEQGEMFEFNTDPCTATTLTLTLTDLYDGASFVLDYDSNVVCDTLTIVAGDGSGDTILESGCFDDNARNHIRIDVFAAGKDAEVVSVIYTTIA